MTVGLILGLTLLAAEPTEKKTQSKPINLPSPRATVLATTVPTAAKEVAPPKEIAHYLFVFGCQDEVQTLFPQRVHTFATWVQTEGDKIREDFTISWYPKGEFRLISPPEVGANLTLHDTLRRCNSRRVRVYLWGPYRISDDFYARGRKQYDFLERAEQNGLPLYKALDGNSRTRAGGAVNCIHAVSDISGGRLLTGFRTGPLAASGIVDHFRSMGLVSTPREPTEWIWLEIKPRDGNVIRMRN